MIFLYPDRVFLFAFQAYKGQRNSEDERHGFGKAILPNGDAYVGTYKNGKRHGRGQYRFVNGAIYQGCYREGLRNGKGVMVYNDKSKYEGDPQYYRYLRINNNPDVLGRCNWHRFIKYIYI